jgi:DNA-binding CsgD family transcriptional regulator
MKLTKAEYEVYLEFCKSEREKQTFKLLLEGKTQNQVASKIDVHPRTIRKIKKRVMDRAATKGYSPEHDIRHKIPDNLILKGTSTLYKTDENGNTTKALEWIKTNADAQHMVEVMQGVLDALREDIPSNPLDSVKKAQSFNDDLLNLHVVADYHLGMFAWNELSGEDGDWTTERAERFIVEWFKQSIQQSPDAKVGLLLNLGDFFTSDSTDPVTPTSKHLLDVDVKFQQMIRIGTKVIRQIIEMMREKYEVVYLYNVAGNHDFSSTMWLKEFFYQFYENCEDVIVDRSGDIYHAHEHGNVSLFFHHGHKKNVSNVADVFVSKFRDLYGRTKHSYAHLGHFHHQHTKESNLCLVEQHRTMIPTDAYASNGGYLSGRSAYVITYHKEYGEVGLINIGAKMVEENI